MKKSDFKKILKPLIKEAVKEVILEEKGVLSNIISEVARGLNGNVVMESKKEDSQALKQKEEEYERQRQERIRKLNESARMQADVFENTSPAPESAGQGALSGVSANDPGIDITGILKLADNKWRKLV